MKTLRRIANIMRPPLRRMTPIVCRQFSNDSSLELVKGMSDWEAFLEKEKPRAAYFTASWCGPCQQIKPIYEAMAAHEDNQGISFAKIDVDEARDVGQLHALAATVGDHERGRADLEHEQVVAHGRPFEVVGTHGVGNVVYMCCLD